MMKHLLKHILLFFAVFSAVAFRAQQCTISSATIFHSGDNSGNRLRNNPENTSDNLLPFITVSDISGGTYVNSTGQTLCSTTMGNATLFRKTGVGTAYNSSVFYNYTIVTSTSSPIIYASRFSAILPAFDGILNNPAIATDRLAYYLRVSITDGTTGVETTVVNSILINQMSGVSSAVDYKMLPGRTYTVKYYAWKSSGSCTDLYLDNPRLYLSPIPNATTANACFSSYSGTVGTALAPYVTSTTPTGLSLRWLQGTTDVTGNTIASGTYTPYYYNSTSTCYMPAGNALTVGANPIFTSDQTPGTQTVCQNVKPAILAVSANNVTYQWYSNTTNSNTGGTLIPGATSDIYSPSNSVVGTIYYYAVITNASGCSTASNVRGVTITPLPTITTQPDSTAQNLCVNGTSTTLTVTATNALTYQWFYSDAATGGTITSITGATSSSYTVPTDTPFATRYYFVRAYNGNAGCSTASSPRTPVTVSANPSFTTNLTAGSETVCQNTPATALSVTANNATYQWYSNTSNSTTGGTLISGANSNTYTPSTAVAGTTYYYVVLTSTSGSGCSTSSNIRSVVVNAYPSAVSVTPATQTLLQNATPANLTATATGASTYQWYSNTTSSNTGGTLISGANALSYTPPTNVVGTQYYYIVASNGTCSAASNVAQVNVQTCNAADPVSLDLNLWFSTSAAPSGSVKQWHSSATPSASTLISGGIVQATSVPTNYWVYYYDSVNNCYSPGSKVVVVANSCCNIPTVNLNSLSQSAAPSGSSLVWYTTHNRVNGTLVSNPSAVSTGVYFPFFYDSVNNCYSPVGTPVLVGIDNDCSSTTDIQVNKTGPYNVAPGATVTYKIYVTNNGTGNASNVVLKDLAVANFTATSVTCENGWGNSGESTCPGSVTIAELQGSGLIIPSLPNGSAVVFTVTGTAGSSGSITNTATVEFTGDTNPANNTSTVVTTISSGTCSETTYRLNPTATVAANPVAINGGTINLVYSRDTGVAISGIGDSFTVPVTYSDLNNQFGVDNQWQFVVTNSGVSLVPNTSTGAGGIFNALPSLNTVTNLPIVNYDSTDHTLSYHMKQGTILPLGQFAIDISNYPALPLGVAIGSQSFQTLTINNDEYGSADISSGYLLKPLIQNKVNQAFSAATLPVEMQPGQEYRFRYTAVGNGASTNAGNRGLVFRGSNYVTFKYNCSCYKTGLTMGGTILDTKVGVSALGRAGADDRDNWPMTRKGGHIALESKTKAFVPNRVAFDASGNPIGIVAANFVEGMMVYDTTNKCLKIYTLKEGDSAMAWHCFTTQACPE